MTGESDQLAEPVVVITGAAKGIGLATAQRLAATHRVAMLDRDRTGLAEAVAEVGDRAAGFVCDITDQAAVSAAVSDVVARFGRIDAAVSNAGIGVVGAARHLDPDVLRVQLEVNLVGNWRFVHACLPHLERSRGYVLGVASAAAIMAPPGEAFYSASKAGFEALLDVLRVEVAHLGIGVGVAYLMFIDTPMVRTGDAEHADLLYMRKRLPGPAGKTYPVERAGQALAAAVRRRSRQVFVPSSLHAQHWLRGMVRPLLDRTMLPGAAEVDRLTLEKVAERGTFDAAFNRGQSPGKDRRAAPRSP